MLLPALWMLGPGSVLPAGLWLAQIDLEPLFPAGTLVPGLAWWRLAAGLVFLGYAVVSDLAWRRVKNATWVLMAAVGAVFLLMDLTRASPNAIYIALIPAFALLAYALWHAHLLYGGADAKALMAIALLVPYPLDLGSGLPVAGTIFPGFVTVLVDSLLLFLAIPLFYFVANLATGNVAFPAMLLGRKMALGRAVEAKVWIMDRLEEDRRVLDLFPTRDEAYDQKVERLVEAGVEKVWVTPKVPFMVPLAAGFVAAHLVGDVLPWLLLRLR